MCTKKKFSVSSKRHDKMFDDRQVEIRVLSISLIGFGNFLKKKFTKMSGN